MFFHHLYMHLPWDQPNANAIVLNQLALWIRSAKRTGTYSFFFLKKVFALFIVCVCTYVQISVHVCVLDVEVKKNFQESVTSFYLWVSGIKVRLGSNSLYLLCQLVSPGTYSFIKMPFLWLRDFCFNIHLLIHFYLYPIMTVKCSCYL